MASLYFFANKFALLKRKSYLCKITKEVNMDKITTRKQYDKVKEKVDLLIAEATEKGMLEPDMDNDYTREIARLSQQMALFEDGIPIQSDYEWPS